MNKSFYNNGELKAEGLRSLQRHIEADELVQGLTGRGGKGCHLWCLADIYDVRVLSEKFNLPRWLLKLEDEIFEGLSEQESKIFSLEVYKAMPVGVDLDVIEKPFLLFILEDVRATTENLAIDKVLKAQVLDCIEGSRKALISGDKEERKGAARAAWDASAAWGASTAGSAAASAAAAASTAGAGVAVWGAGAASGESTAFEKYALKLIELLTCLNKKER